MAKVELFPGYTMGRPNYLCTFPGVYLEVDFVVRSRNWIVCVSARDNVVTIYPKGKTLNPRIFAQFSCKKLRRSLLASRQLTHLELGEINGIVDSIKERIHT